jgi:LPS sulfotransferase NodH
MAERAFLVCATPRSGSTLVCQALKKTGVAGRPEEYFDRQAVSLWKAVQTATWREEDARRDRPLDDWDESLDSPPYRSFLQDHRPQLRFHYRAIEHLLEHLLVEEASWDAFFEHCGVRPTLILYENFASDPRTSTLSLLDRLGLPAPADVNVEPRMKRQSDGINDDWVQRFGELRLGTEFDLVPAVPRPVGDGRLPESV